MRHLNARPPAAGAGVAGFREKKTASSFDYAARDPTIPVTMPAIS
jgi:hypothetical protein